MIKIKLQTIHPNPGPRNKTEEAKKKRREKRYQRRNERRRLKKEAKEKIIRVATWNVQRMSLGTRNKRKAKNVAEYARKEDLDIVLLSEVRSERNGTAWFGEESNLTAITFCKKAAILLRGHLLEKWCEGGQTVEFKERSLAVKIEDFIFVSTYQPVFRGDNAAEIEAAKQEVKELIKDASREKVLIVGGDFNAHIGQGEDRQGVCGRFGLRESNEQGRILLDWCEENNLAQVNSFFNHQRRGTWFSIPLRRWYELDGFLMRDNQRHKFVKKVWTANESTLSDHKPKIMRLEMNRKLKKKKKIKRPPRIKWEKLKNPEIKQRYREKIAEIRQESEDQEEVAEDNRTRWKEITETVNKAAVEVCGVLEKKIQDPWMVDKDEEIAQMRARISDALDNRNNLIENRVNDERLEEAKEELKAARRELQQKTRRWESEWWEEKIEACKRASETGDSGTMYRLLKEIEHKGKTKAPNSTTLTKEDFKQQFQSISAERFENTPEEIDEALEQVEDISNTEKARQWRDQLNEIPSGEEIWKQMKMMKDSAPGEDGVRLLYLLEAGPEIMAEVIQMIQFMFCNSADKWEDQLKIGLVIALHKK